MDWLTCFSERRVGRAKRNPPPNFNPLSFEPQHTLLGNNIILYGLAAGGEVDDLTQLVEATGGSSYHLSANSNEAIGNITNALVDLETSGQLVLEADNPLYVESITPKIIDIADMSAGDEIQFTVIFNKISISESKTVEFSQRSMG